MPVKSNIFTNKSPEYVLYELARSEHQAAYGARHNKAFNECSKVYYARAKLRLSNEDGVDSKVITRLSYAMNGHAEIVIQTTIWLLDYLSEDQIKDMIIFSYGT